MPFQLDIVTPEKRVFSEQVDSVTLPGSEGELGILPQHIALVTALNPGELAFAKSGKIEHLAIGTGFVEVTGRHVSVLTDMALGEGEIDEKTVEEALKRAQDQLEALKHDTGSEELAFVMANIQKSMAQLTVKRRRRTV
ncbi:MAG: ATP synthase F1 subunit epsilon [Roseimicrobium sp.]